MKALQRSLDWLENPEVYAVNREEAHSSRGNAAEAEPERDVEVRLRLVPE